MYSTENKTSANDATKSFGKINTLDTKYEPEAYNVAGPSKAKKAKRKPKSEEPYKEEKKGGVYTLMVKQPPQKEALVYCEGKDIWDCKLYQTNIGENNNKYFLLQLRKENGENAYSVWRRWGRVGYQGQEIEKSHGDNLEKAKNEFKKKFKDKTKNNWDQRMDFEKVPGEYDLLAIEYEIQGSNDPSAVKLEKEESDPSDPGIGEYRYKLKSEQIEAGKSSLEIIKNCKEEAKRIDACNEFYTKIPHDFRMKAPELIMDMEAIAKKRKLLKELNGKIMNSLEFWIERT
uniref:NAD(+) ADP-ribosyltransferase n=1 Tax=Crassostrea virginica TaxID=6565 RepID=A0A8B8ETD6_CRAVI|nr:poly [ADP-ribose] polymerase 2-like isoform X3 [Crassostrea virginica]